MHRYTVIYTECWTTGSHQQASVRYKHVEAESVQKAYDMLCGAAIYVFPGHIEPLEV